MRCVSIDWLELFASEDPARRYEPEDFESRGYIVTRRGYGTRTFEQAFTICDTHGDPMIEILRAPRGVDGIKKTVYRLGDCYLRLVNAYCYTDHPVDLLLEFMQREGIMLRRIFRIDLAIDLAEFDRGDKPRSVMKRIVDHTYAKINQTNRRLSGTDRWTECEDNWVSWGAPGSMVSTKFYNKSKEIRDEKFAKTWILQRWMHDGLIDNPLTISKDGKEQEIWRVEFSIHSSAKEWVLVEKDESHDAVRHYLPHSVDLYSERKGVLNAIANLEPHYFRFKIYQEGKVKYKCPDKVLFVWKKDEVETNYRLTSESDLDRDRKRPNGQDITDLTILNRVMARSRSEEVKRHLAEAIKELNKAVTMDFDDETFMRAYLLAQGDLERAREIVQTPIPFI